MIDNTVLSDIRAMIITLLLVSGLVLLLYWRVSKELEKRKNLCDNCHICKHKLLNGAPPKKSD